MGSRLAVAGLAGFAFTAQGRQGRQGHIVTRLDSCPKLLAIYTVDKKQGRLADRGLRRIVDHAAVAALLWSKSRGGLVYAFRSHAKQQEAVNALHTSLEFSQRHDVIEHCSRSAFGSVSGRRNRTVTASVTLVKSKTKTRAKPGGRQTGDGQSIRPGTLLLLARQEATTESESGVSQVVCWWHPFGW